MSVHGLEGEVAGIGLVLPLRGLRLNPSESVTNMRNPRAGVPSPEGGAGLAVSGMGSAPNLPVRIRTQRGGSPGVDRGCSFIWQEEGGEWFGDDPVTALSGVRNILPAKAGEPVEAAFLLDALGLGDGSSLALVYVARDSLPPELRIIRLGVSGEVHVGTITEIPATTDPAGCLCRLPNGKILVYYALRDITAERLQLRMFFSDNGGDSWFLGADGALEEPLFTGETDNVPIKLSAAIVDSTISLFLSVVRGAGFVEANRNQGYQFVSRDGGSNLFLVWSTDEETEEIGHKAHSSISVRTSKSHVLIVTWIGEDGYSYSVRLGSPFDPIDANLPVPLDDSRPAVPSGVAIARKVSALEVLPDGRLLAVTTCGEGAESCYRGLVSLDGGVTWGVSAVSLGNSGIFLRGFSLSEVALPVLLGSGVGLLTQGNGASWTPSVYLLRLGGPSTITLPSYFSSSSPESRISWLRSWDATSDPADQEWISESVTGTGSYELLEDTLVTTTASGDNNVLFTESYSSEVDSDLLLSRGVLRKVTIRNINMSAAGATFNDIETAFTLDSAVSGRVRFALRIGSNNAGIADLGAGGTTVSPSGSVPLGVEHDYLITYRAAKVIVYYRVTTVNDVEPWVLLVSRDLVVGASTSPGLSIVWGARWNGSVSYRWNATAPGGWAGVGLPDPYSPLRDLEGRSWSAVASPVGFQGTTIRGEGVTYRGDSWILSPDSEERVTNALIGGPRMGWASEDTAEQSLILDLASENTAIGSDVLVIAGFGSNIGAIKVEGILGDGSSDTLYEGSLSIALDGLASKVSGRSSWPSNAEPSDSEPLAAKDEFAGCYFSFYDADEEEWISSIITGNREGKWKQNSSTPLVMELLEDLGAERGVTARIIPREWAIQVSLNGGRYARFRVSIPAPSPSIPSPPEGFWRLGRLFLGYAVAQAMLPSWGDRVTHEPLEEVVESADGQRSGIVRAPTRRLFRIGFIDGSNTYRIQSPTFEGDPGVAAFFGVSGSSEGLGIEGLEVLSLDGVLRAVGGAGEMVYLATLERGALKVHNRRDALALVYFDSNTARERIGGFSLPYGDGIRGDTFDLKEAT